MSTCLLTFDVEDWFQTENLRPIFPPESWDTIPLRVADSTRIILRLLAEARLPATFFVLGWVAEREPELVRDIARAGHEVASHGYGHVLPMHLTLDQFREDVLRARKILEDISGAEVIGYRAPSFSIDTERVMLLAECGFRYDSSHHPFALHDRYGRLDDLGSAVGPGVYRPGGQIVEIGLPIEQIGPFRFPAAGGGYFRLYPGVMFRRLVRRTLARQRHYAMYLHSWEFDPAQPRVRRAGLVRTFRHYNNLSRTLPRMRQLIDMLKRMNVRFLTGRQFVDETSAPPAHDARAGRRAA
jgi:polysaccharide deacetylase family protein (PEP-CTERM system associated)